MKITTLTSLLLMACTALAGDKVGNGGGLWACLDSQENVRYGILVDLYEAREQHGLPLINHFSADSYSIVNERKEFAQKYLPARAPTWSAYLDDVYKKMRLTDAVLTEVDDALYPISPLPVNCPNGKWKYLQFANYLQQSQQILIRKDLWQHPNVSTLDKAALIWHEAIYAWLRDSGGDKDSRRARHIVGLLFSQLPPFEIQKQIEEIIVQQPPVQPPTQPPQVPEEKWVCLVENSLNSKVFVGYGKVEKQARTSSLQACQEAGEGFHCNENTFQCDQMPSMNKVWFCETSNGLTNKVFSGEGRSKVEAMYESRNACIKSGYHQHCSDRPSCESSQ